MATKVVLSGATGHLGPSVLKALLNADFQVTILTRKGSTTTKSLPPHANQRIVEVDYTSQDELIAALKGNDVLVSTMEGRAVEPQKAIADAAVAAGIRRFIPSEFGSDLTNPTNRSMPVFQTKVQVHEYVEKLAREHPAFTYTYITTNVFFDFGLQAGFFATLKDHHMTVFDGGDHPVSLTTMATIGKAVVAVIKNQSATQNRNLFVHDVAISQNDLMALIKGVDGKEWTTTQKDTKELYAAGIEELAKPEPNFFVAMVNQVYRAAFGKGTKPEFSGRSDNELLGLVEDDMAYIDGVVRGLL